MTTTSRGTLHDMVDELADEDLWLVEAYLAYRLGRDVDPSLVRLALTPYDDEPLTPEEVAAIAEGREAIARGETYSQEEIKREFGL